MEILELLAGLIDVVEAIDGLYALARGACRLMARAAGWLLR